MKTCLIYGHNGLDLDVTINIKSFYKELGFKTVFSTHLYAADLLVVLRAVDKEIDLSSFNYSLIHIYDYGGWDYDKFIKSINHSNSFIFCTSESKRERLIKHLQFPKERVFIALPPVDVNIWCKELCEIKFETVHIGNFKPINSEDLISPLFNQAIIHFKTNVWGLGWNICKQLYHGKAGLFMVSNIYAKSKFTFGLMYPFQREVTFSGRFWHAPLNGCSVFSEPGLFPHQIPGIITTDYTLNDIKLKMLDYVDRFALQKEAVAFWNKKYQETINIVRPTIKGFKENEFRIKSFFIINYIALKNCLRLYYQKLGLFRFFTR